MRAHGGWFQNRPFQGLRTPKSEIYDPQNLVKNPFFRTRTIFSPPKVHPKRSLTHLHRPLSDQNCPKASGARKVPMWTCHVTSALVGPVPTWGHVPGAYKTRPPWPSVASIPPNTAILPEQLRCSFQRSRVAGPPWRRRRRGGGRGLTGSLAGWLGMCSQEGAPASSPRHPSTGTGQCGGVVPSVLSNQPKALRTSTCLPLGSHAHLPCSTALQKDNHKPLQKDNHKPGSPAVDSAKLLSHSRLSIRFTN